MKVRFIANSDTLALIKNKVYDVISIERGWYRIYCELHDDYLFPPEAFEIVDETED
jgi:hypothetical protein